MALRLYHRRLPHRSSIHGNTWTDTRHPYIQDNLEPSELSVGQGLILRMERLTLMPTSKVEYVLTIAYRLVFHYRHTDSHIDIQTQTVTQTHRHTDTDTLAY